MNLPRLDRHFAVFYHSENFIRKFTEAIDLEKKIIKSIRLSTTNFQYTLASGDTVSVFEEPYLASCGQRADIVFIEDGISQQTMWEVALPMACIGEKSVWVWRNDKWFRFEELYKPQRNYFKEAEEWLASLEI